METTQGQGRLSFIGKARTLGYKALGSHAIAITAPPCTLPQRSRLLTPLKGAERLRQRKIIRGLTYNPPRPSIFPLPPPPPLRRLMPAMTKGHAPLRSQGHLRRS